MKKLFSYLLTLVVLLMVVGAFYVLEIYPFNPGGPIVAKKTPPLTTDTVTDEQLAGILDETKVGRAQTYGEHLKRGALLYEKGYSTLALAEYEQAATLQPNIALPLVEMGDINFELQDFINAKIDYERAIAIDSNSLSAKIGLAKTYLATRKVEDAKAVLDSIAVHNQTSKYFLAMTLSYIGDHENAKNIFNEVIQLGTSQILSSYALNFINAYREFDSYQAGQTVHLKTLLGRAFIHSKEYEIAIPLLFDVIKEKKDYRDAWILLGYAYLSSDKYQDAIDALATARKLDPEKPQTLFFLGLAYYGMHDYSSSISYLELAKKNGYEPASYIDQKLAELYLNLQEYEKSANSYENLLVRNDNSIDYFIRPIWIYIDKLNQPEKAITLAEKAVKKHPSNAMSYNLLGWAHLGAGQLMSAQMYLDRAHTMDPNLDATYLNYGKLYQQKGETQKALSNYQIAYDMGKGNSISLAAADLYNRLLSPEKNISQNNQTFPTETLKADLLNN